MLNNEKLHMDAVSQFERDQKAKREAVRFAVALAVGVFVFAALTFWWTAR